MGSTRFRNPRALSSALAALGTLQPRALGFLNRVDPLVSVSNLYLCAQNSNHSTLAAHARTGYSRTLSKLGKQTRCIVVYNATTIGINYNSGTIIIWLSSKQYKYNFRKSSFAFACSIHPLHESMLVIAHSTMVSCKEKIKKEGQFT